MKHKILYIPTFVYSISYSIFILFYIIGWTNLYPNLSWNLGVFLLSTVLLSGVLSLYQKQKIRIQKSKINLSPSFIKYGFLFIAIGTILDFIYERSVPLITTFINPSYSYSDFNGVPTLHVLVATFNIFFSIIMFDYYYMNKSKKNFILFIQTLLPSILMMNRGAFMVIFCALIFIFLMRLPKLNIKKIFFTTLMIISVLYMFGVMGNIRQQQTKEEKEYLLRVGGATNSFINSPIPSEFYWSYIYIASPIGNLQNIINNKSDKFEEENLGIFTVSQLFPDFISNRLVDINDYKIKAKTSDAFNYLVTPLLNAPTTYYMPYYFLGIVGMIIMYLCLTLASFVYPLLIKNNSPFYIASIAALNSIILLSTFNNMWFNIGTVLIWPLVLNFFSRLNFK